MSVLSKLIQSRAMVIAVASGMVLFVPAPLAAQSDEPIIIDEMPAPPVEISSIEVSCFGSRYRLAVRNSGLASSQLEAVHLDGAALPIEDGRFSELSNFLRSTRNTYIVLSRCKSPGQVTIALQGIKLAGEKGDAGDFLKLLTVDFK